MKNKSVINSPLLNFFRAVGHKSYFSGLLVLATCVLYPVFEVNAQQELKEVNIAVLRQIVVRPPNLSNLEVPPENEGFAGAEVSISDNNTTGRFLGQKFTLVEEDVPAGGDIVSSYEKLRAQGIQFFVVDAPATSLLALSVAANDDDVLFFNASARDNELRNGACRANILHIAPSRAMMTDALLQYLVRKRWRDLFLVIGTRPEDELFAASVRASAKKFGAKIVEERRWDFGPDARRVAQAEVPKLTQGVKYDVLIVADELGIFGEYLMFRTWEPRLVAGTQGLIPTTWHKTHEQWGSAQLQSRFEKKFNRKMSALDYQVWAPIRAIGEAATRTNSNDFAKMVDYLRGDDFELAGFKGLPLTFRKWNGQLRQPILLSQPASLVSVSPQEGFLHRRTVLDTMGFDKPESHCDLN